MGDSDAMDAAALRAGADHTERLALVDQLRALVLDRQAKTRRHLAALERKLDACRQIIVAASSNVQRAG